MNAPRLVALVAAAALLATPAAGFHRDSLPFLGSGGGPGQGWVAWKTTLDGSSLAIDAVATGYARPLFFGIAIENATTGRVVSAGGAGFFRDASTGTVLHVHAPGFDHDSGAMTTPTSGAFTLPITINPPYFTTKLLGPHRILLWASAAEMTSWSWTLRGSAAQAPSATTTGSDAAVRPFHEFNGTLSAHAHGGTHGARAVAAASTNASFANSAWGFFFNVPGRGVCRDYECQGPGSYLLTAAGPDGPQNCGGLCYLLGDPAGAWTFRATGGEAYGPPVAVVRCTSPSLPPLCVGPFADRDEVVLTYADATLPP